MQASKYWIEVVLIVLLFAVGIQCINYYRDANEVQRELALLTRLDNAISELKFETVLADFSNTYHYDRHAELQLDTERIIGFLPRSYAMQNDLKQFIHLVSSYMQLATVLKTSRGFVASSHQYFGHNNELAFCGERLLSYFMEFLIKPNDVSKQVIEDFIIKNESILQSVSDSNVQWSMLKKHINFVLDNSLPAYKMLVDIQELSIDQQLSNIATKKNQQLLKLSHRWGFYLTAVIGLLFSLFALALIRQGQQLKIKSDLAEQASEVKTQFLANMSHEIRTPMNGILGLADLCLKTDLNADQKQYVEKLQFSAKALMAIINDILDFSKIESQQLTIEKIEFDLYELLAHIKIMLAKSAADKSLELVFDVDPRVSEKLIGDPVRIGQILMNLMANAIKFTGQGSVVLAIRPEDSGIIFTVTDTGIGMTAEQQSRIFQRFSQAEASTTRKYGGTGLGLAICKLLAEMMDGNIQLSSQYGQGSCFTLFLPIVVADMDEQYLLPAIDQYALLISDDSASSEAFKVLSESLGIATKIENTSQKIGDMLAGRNFNFLVLDWASFLTIKNNVDQYLACVERCIVITHCDDYDQQQELTAKGILPLSRPVLKPELSDILLKKPEKPESDHDQFSQSAPLVDDQTVAKEKLVLLVEDNEINQLIAMEIIQSIGVRVDLATNGVEALEMIAKHAYNLVFMDIQMPEMDGVEATTKIREEYSSIELPVIALTANVMESEIRHYRRIGMNDCLGKPFDPEQIEAAVRHYCFSTPMLPS